MMDNCKVLQDAFNLYKREFHIEAELGEGSFGRVFKAKSKQDGKSYAMKILIPIKDDDKIVQIRQEKYQKNELESLIRLRISESAERHVIKYFNSWYLQVGNETRLCIQMELCSASLDKFVYDNQMGGASIVEDQGPPRFYQHVFRQILKALKVIHSMGWVHRDIHPGNILIANSNVKQISDINVKIADFGLARHIGMGFGRSTGGSVSPITEELSIWKHQFFGAPEISTTSYYDFKVDLYSAGMVLYFISCYLTDMSKWESELKALKDGKIDIKARVYHKDDLKLPSLIENLLQKNPTKRLSAHQAKKYMLPTRTEDSIDAGKVTTYFIARKHDEKKFKQCSLKVFTLAALKEELKARLKVSTGVEAGQQVLLWEERMVNGVERVINIECDRDVELMFQSAAQKKLEVVIVCERLQTEVKLDDNDIDMKTPPFRHQTDDSL